jgi:catalase
MGIQVFPDNPEQTFEGIDLLDPTKLVPEELAPVQIIGRLTLNANPTNYFAETEQVAFCTSHVPRGIDFTDDPLLQARNFSYLDTQLTRLGGPNFDQLPINRPQSPVNTTQRDGFGQQAVAEGNAAYTPNSIGGGCPFAAGAEGFVQAARSLSGTRARVRAQSFGDHFSQATMFWNSMSQPEQDHIVAAFSFELGKCLNPDIKDRTLTNLARVHADLVRQVAANLGLKPPRSRVDESLDPSPALSLLPSAPGPIAGRVIGVLTADGVDNAGLAKLRKALEAEGASLIVIAPRGGSIKGASGTVEVTKSSLTTQSVEYDALLLAGGESALTVGVDPYTAVNVGEAYRHHKPVAAWGEGCAVLEALGIEATAAGVVTADKVTPTFLAEVIESIGWHRYWDR